MVEDLTHDPPLGKSHHDCLVSNYRCYSKRNSNVKKKFKLNLGNHQGLEQACNAINWDYLLNSESITQMWNTSKKILELCKKYIPISLTSLKNRRLRPVWWKKELMEIIRQKRTAHIQKRNSGTGRPDSICKSVQPGKVGMPQSKRGL